MRGRGRGGGVRRVGGESGVVVEGVCAGGLGQQLTELGSSAPSFLITITPGRRDDTKWAGRFLEEFGLGDVFIAFFGCFWFVVRAVDKIISPVWNRLVTPACLSLYYFTLPGPVVSDSRPFGTCAVIGRGRVCGVRVSKEAPPYRKR